MLASKGRPRLARTIHARQRWLWRNSGCCRSAYSAITPRTPRPSPSSVATSGAPVCWLMRSRSTAPTTCGVGAGIHATFALPCAWWYSQEYRGTERRRAIEEDSGNCIEHEDTGYAAKHREQAPLHEVKANNVHPAMEQDVVEWRVYVVVYAERNQ